MKVMDGLDGFEWDESNAPKLAKHAVSPLEAEEVFTSGRRVRVLTARSTREPRFLALGETLGGRRLVVVWTVRGSKVRVISARPMSRKERRVYES